MLQAGTAFIGGVMAANRLADMTFPQFSRAVDDGERFRLYVHVVSASIPGLADPGLLKRERPRLEVVLGEARKATEFADFKRDSSTELGESESPSPPGSSPWRFGDTLTFPATGADVLGPGVQLWLRTNSDVNLGVIQVNLAQMREIGTCSVNLRRDVLPQCVPKNNGAQGGLGLGAQAGDNGTPHQIWESPVMALPLAHVGADNSPYVLAEAAAHVSVTFGVNVNPQTLLRLADEKMRPLVERVSTPLRQWIQEPVRWVYEASTADCAACDIDGARPARCVTCPAGLDLPKARRIVSARAAEVYEAAAGGCSPTSCAVDTTPTVITRSRSAMPGTGPADAASPFFQGPGVVSPDLSSDGWVSHVGPNGRHFWHHLSLGPPPWELQAAAGSAASMGHASPVSRQRAARTPSSSSSAVPFPQPLSLPAPAAARGAGAAAGPGTPVGTPVGTPLGTPLARMRQVVVGEQQLQRQQQQQQQQEQQLQQQQQQQLVSAERVQAEPPAAAGHAGGGGAPLARPVAAEEGAASKILERSVPSICTAYVTQVSAGNVVRTHRGLPARQSFQAAESGAALQRTLPARTSFQTVEAHHGHVGLPARTSFAGAVETHHGHVGLPARTSFAGVVEQPAFVRKAAEQTLWAASAAPRGSHAGGQAFFSAPATVLVGARR